MTINGGHQWVAILSWKLECHLGSPLSDSPNDEGSSAYPKSFLQLEVVEQIPDQ